MWPNYSTLIFVVDRMKILKFIEKMLVEGLGLDGCGSVWRHVVRCQNYGNEIMLQ
jgi:hypothetical protein